MATAWELDRRPAQPCVVCHGVPHRAVALPRLPDVHLVFGSSAMCEACAGLAASNAVDGLTRRGEARWADEPDSLSSLVRVVVAAFGHQPPPAAIAPAAFRHRHVEPLSDVDAATWRRLEPLIYDGPPGDPVRVLGTIEYSTDDEHRVTVALRDGPKARLADGDGRPWLLCDGETMWCRDPDSDSDEMYASPCDGEDRWAGDGSDLAARRPRGHIELFGFGTPLGPIEATIYLGRRAWRFRFAAPRHKPFDMAVLVDDETGLVLEKRFGDYSTARWTAFDSEVDLPADLFVWTGPVVDQDRRRREEQERDEQQRQDRLAWFAAHVTAQALTVRGAPVEVMLHDSDDTGAFDASLHGTLRGALARRPRSERWWDLGWSDVTYRWSDERWDWALCDFGDVRPPLTADELHTLRQALTRR